MAGTMVSLSIGTQTGWPGGTRFDVTRFLARLCEDYVVPVSCTSDGGLNLASTTGSARGAGPSQVFTSTPPAEKHSERQGHKGVACNGLVWERSERLPAKAMVSIDGRSMDKISRC